MRSHQKNQQSIKVHVYMSAKSETTSVSLEDIDHSFLQKHWQFKMSYLDLNNNKNAVLKSYSIDLLVLISTVRCYHVYTLFPQTIEETDLSPIDFKSDANPTETDSSEITQIIYVH